MSDRLLYWLLIAWARFTIITKPSPPFLVCDVVMVPGLLQFSPQLRDKIWEWPGDKARLLGGPILIRGGLSLHQRQCREVLIKVTMNKLCVRLFIIIFTIYTRKSECIPTVTNFASILANYFYFLRKITAQRPSVLNFRGRLVKFCQKSSGQTVRK